MKNTKYIHGLSNFGHCGFLAVRSVWNNQEQAPDVGFLEKKADAQEEYKDIMDLVNILEGRRSQYTMLKSRAVMRLAQKIKDNPEYFTPELLDALANRKEASIRAQVAMCPITTLKTLARLARDKDEDVKAAAKKYREYRLEQAESDKKRRAKNENKK